MQAEQTDDGDYESISYHTFRAVDYDRYMSWKAGSGSVGVGVREITKYGTDADKEDVLLPAGRSVVVVDTEFKLVRKT
ncbi:hypothetical protein B0J14DRAFT_489000 [Halenospora varia]|nr:hypothetical protein B0J14DRAFT_489000 [Halenospora varia]